METLQDAIIVIGACSVICMWAMCTIAGAGVVWETVGEHVTGMIQRLVDRVQRR